MGCDCVASSHHALLVSYLLVGVRLDQFLHSLHLEPPDPQQHLQGSSSARINTNIHNTKNKVDLRHGPRGLPHFGEAAPAALLPREALVVLVLPAQREQLLEQPLLRGLPVALVRQYCSNAKEQRASVDQVQTKYLSDEIAHRWQGPPRR